MEPSSTQFFPNGFGTSNGSKFSSGPSGRPPLGSHEFHSQVEQNSTAGSSPSMTTGSTKSGPSSVMTCENCRGSNPRCGCQSDSESIRIRNYETECPQSPNMSEYPVLRPGKIWTRVQNSSLHNRVCVNTTLRHAHKFVGSHFSQDNDNIQSYCEEDITNDMSSLPIRTKILQHALEDTTIYTEGERPESQGSANLAEDEDSDSDMGEDGDESDESEDDNSDDDWNGQDDNLEAIILEALQGDLPFAAKLIPILHHHLYSEMTTSTAQKVSPWRYGIKNCSPGAGRSNSEQTSSSNARASDSTSNPRKRQRRMGSQDQGLERDEDDEDDDEDGNEKRRPNEADGNAHDNNGPELPRLACPFHKRDPAYYGIRHGATQSSKKTDYRSCAGPGFKSIQRLKEHLKRKHYPVQCDRCGEIFSGSDRARCVAALQSHLQLPIPCGLQIPSQKEGISDAQWASLDKKKSNKKSQETSRIDKWMEIWVILFAEIPQPDTPWYDESNSRLRLSPPSQESRRFGVFFRHMLDLQVSQQHIRFVPGEEEEMEDRVQNLVQKACAVYLGVNGVTSLTDSSSFRSRQDLSYLGGSFEHLSTPGTTRVQYSPSGSRSAVDLGQSFLLMDASGTPSESPLAAPVARRGSMMGPFIGMQQMGQQSFMQNTTGTSIPPDYSNNSRYPPGLPDDLITYDRSPFHTSNSGPTAHNLFEMDFAGSSNFNSYSESGNIHVGDFHDPSADSLNHLMNAPEDGTQINLDDNWQYETAPQ